MSQFNEWLVLIFLGRWYLHDYLHLSEQPLVYIKSQWRIQGEGGRGRHMAKGSILKNLVPRKTGLKIRTSALNVFNEKWPVIAIYY